MFSIVNIGLNVLNAVRKQTKQFPTIRIFTIIPPDSSQYHVRGSRQQRLRSGLISQYFIQQSDSIGEIGQNLPDI
jgi:hypothetical protein